MYLHDFHEDKLKTLFVMHCLETVSHPSYEFQTNGIVLTVGQGDVGQLGLGEDITERKRPAIVTNLEGKDVVQIVSGGMHTTALSSNGEVCHGDFCLVIILFSD